MSTYDAVIVGAGMFGATLARELTDRGRKVLVIDKRLHLAGSCFTERIEGIAVGRFGPHVFHTNDERIWKYAQRFAQFLPFITRTKASHRGRLYSFPINLMTLYQLWGVRTPEEAKRKLEAVRHPIPNPANLEEWVLSTLGREIYETFIYGYTVKQWGREPSRLPASIVKRLPVRLTFDDNYFTDVYQGVPSGGYTPMFERMLEGIEVRLSCDYLTDRSVLDRMGQVVYSGRIDEYFDYCLGPLEFRTCLFENKVLEGDYQGNAVINYTDMEDQYTRIVEHKHFARVNSAKTVVTWEYPRSCGKEDAPLYPVNDQANMDLFDQYRRLPTRAIFAGRLGMYRYVDMHQVIAQAWRIADALTGTRRVPE